MLKEYKEMLDRGNALLGVLRQRIQDNEPFDTVVLEFITCNKETLEYIAEIEKELEKHPKILPEDLGLPETKLALEERIRLAYKLRNFDSER